jgi:hypothetical protein
MCSSVAAALKVYFGDLEVPIDTNRLEHISRTIQMGRRNRLLCSTDVGAKYVGILQSLLVTCRLRAINSYDDLVDVLQHIDRRADAAVNLLRPRLWKEHYAANPLRSPLHNLHG